MRRRKQFNKRQQFYISELRCTECGMVMPIPRRYSGTREANHIKDMWCARCKGIRKFIENMEV